MTTAELNAAIADGTMTITKLPTRRPRSWNLVMTRVGGSSEVFRGMPPDATIAKGVVADKAPRRERARLSRNAQRAGR